MHRPVLTNANFQTQVDGIVKGHAFSPDVLYQFYKQYIKGFFLLLLFQKNLVISCIYPFPYRGYSLFCAHKFWANSIAPADARAPRFTTYFNSSPSGRCSNFKSIISEHMLRIKFIANQVNDKEYHWWEINICPGNGLVLCRPMASWDIIIYLISLYLFEQKKNYPHYSLPFLETYWHR